MRLALALVLIGCAAAPPATAPVSRATVHGAIIDHTWPKPKKLPALAPFVRSNLDRPVMLVPQLGPSQPPLVTKPERERLTKLAATATGPTLLAALDRLADALESDYDDAFEQNPDPLPSIDPTVNAYLELIARPGFAAYAKADEVLFRAAHFMFNAGRTKEATDLATQLFTQHPTSMLVADMHVLVADSIWDNPALARSHYEEAMAVGRKWVVDYARARHAVMLTALGEYAAALGECDVIATNRDYRQIAAQTCIRAFAEGGALANARDYFTRLDPDSIADSMRRLAHEYYTLGKIEDATALLEDTLPHLSDWEDICQVRVRLFEARMFVGARIPMLIDAKRLADAAQHTTLCRVEADEQLGQVAWSWQMELPKSESSPHQVDELWQDELEVVTNDARRATALLDRAYLAWQLARSERRAVAWEHAAAALQAAYDADHDSVDVETIAAAHSNASSLRTSP